MRTKALFDILSSPMSMGIQIRFRVATRCKQLGFGRLMATLALAFGLVGCGPRCTDVSALPVVPKGAIADRIEAMAQALAKIPEFREKLTNEFRLPPLFIPNFLIKVNETNSILAARKLGDRAEGKLFEVSGTNVIREIDNPSGDGDVEDLQIVSREPLVFVAHAFRYNSEGKFEHGTWVYSATNRVSRKIGDDTVGIRLSPDGRWIAWRVGIMDRANYEVTELSSGKKRAVLTVCGDGSQLPSPKVFWADATNLVFYRDGKRMWTTTVVYNVESESLTRLLE